MKNPHFELDYKILISNILETGSLEDNRTKTKAYVLFGQDLRIDMSSRLLPIVTGKKIFFDKAYHEYKWIIQGGTTIKYLNEHGINWWDKYAGSLGSLGKTYGYQINNYNGNFNQLSYALMQIKMRTRRAHITLWNPCELEETALPCCYTGITFVVTGNKLNMSMSFRSSDVFLGLPYDIIFAALLLRDMSAYSELDMGEIKLNLENAHIYENHKEQCYKYLSENCRPLPAMPSKDILINYKHGPYIKVPLNN